MSSAESGPQKRDLELLDAHHRLFAAYADDIQIVPEMRVTLPISV